MRILLDTNIILDIALKRAVFFDDSAKIFKQIDNKKTFGFITSTTVTDIYYVAKKEVGHDISLKFLTGLISFVDVIGIDKEILLEALTSDIKDFEDAIQSVASSYSDIDYIITRNIKDFKNSKIKAVLPSEFLNIKK